MWQTIEGQVWANFLVALNEVASQYPTQHQAFISHCAKKVNVRKRGAVVFSAG
jgi:hypothetical protein